MNRTRVLAVLSLALYGFACYAPAVRNMSEPTGPQPPISGLGTLIIGWFPPATIPWSANLMALGGWILFYLKRFRAARLLGVVAFLTALLTWVVLGFQSLLTGYYLWQASFLAFAACAHVADRERANAKAEQSQSAEEIDDAGPARI